MVQWMTAVPRETTSEPPTVPATGDEQRVIMRIRGGFEYRAIEVAQATVF